MDMLEAMRKCLPGGFVSRKAYPNRKYHKSFDGIFYEAAHVDYIDFISSDWRHHEPICRGCIKNHVGYCGKTN